MTRPVRPWLRPLVPAYRLALAVRDFELHAGLKRVMRLQWPVISVGNLAAGGAGKTPLVIALANALTARGVHVDVLSRGYGRQRISALPLLVDPDGTAEEFGDEPPVIARAAGVAVFVAAKRYEAGMAAEAHVQQMESHPGDQGKDVAQAWRPSNRQVGESASRQLRVHLLDDGFQHRQLHRNVDILLLSRGDLQDHLLPAGNLREPLGGAERADAIAIPADEPEVAGWVKARGWERQVWRLRRRMDVPRIDGPVVAFCGIARPEQFFEGLEGAGLRLAERLAFADHHRYAARDLKRIEFAARRTGAAAIVTTEKDRVRLGAWAAKLPAEFPLKTVPLRIEIENAAEAIDWLIKRIAAPDPRES